MAFLETAREKYDFLISAPIGTEIGFVFPNLGSVVTYGEYAAAKGIITSAFPDFKIKIVESNLKEDVSIRCSLKHGNKAIEDALATFVKAPAFGRRPWETLIIVPM